MTELSDTQPLPAIHPDLPSRVQVSGEPDSSVALPSARRKRNLGKWVISIVLSLVVVAAGGILGIMTLIYMQARTDEARHVDMIVVMGAAQYNGQPSAVLRARLDHALALYNAGLAPEIVVTGGKQPGDEYTEAETGYQYLTDRGVPESAIVLENEGRSTWESLEAVPALVPPADAPRVLIVSDGFHLFRSELMLREVGYETWSSPATDSPIRPWSATEFSYVIRETGGVIVFLPTMWWG